jgi:hypothetical protein
VKSYVILCVKICILIYYRKILVVTIRSLKRLYFFFFKIILSIMAKQITVDKLIYDRVVIDKTFLSTTVISNRRR